MKAEYQSFRRAADRIMRSIPLIGPGFYAWVMRLKRGVKAIFYPDNFFVDLGFEYVGPIDGHHLPTLEQVLRDARDLNRPVVVHVTTRKGKGYEFAEDDPSSFHGVGAFSVTDGLFERRGPATFTEAFGRSLAALAAADRSVAAVTAAMEKGTGLSPFRAAYPNRFFDVGIAEGHAVTFAAGLAARGQKPVVAVYSTFLQRAVDQVVHDVAIQTLPVVFALDRAGFVPDDGETHQGLFDIGLLRAVPNLVLLAPASGGELEAMLAWSLASGRPCAIRYPKTACPHETAALAAPLETGRGVFLRESGARLLLACTGGLYPQAAEAADRLAGEGIAADLYHFRFLKPLDEDYLARLLDGYDAVVVVEEGVASGGIGEAVAGLAARRLCRARLVLLSAPDAFPAQGSRDELLAAAGLDAAGIALRASAAWRAPAGLSLVRSGA
jgi:1-deoxy-D-xylulose-5-phosphate synthase